MKTHVGYLSFIIGLLLMMGAIAQQVQRYTQVPGYLVLTTCGTGAPASTYKAGSYATGTVDVNGKFCVNQ